MMQNGAAVDTRGVLVTNRIIVGAMIMGQVLFGVILAAALRVPLTLPGQTPPPVKQGAITGDWLVMLCFGLTAVLLPVALVARSRLCRSIPADASPLMRMQQQSVALLISGAILESFGLLGLVASLLRHNFWPTALCTVVSVVMLAWLMPRATPSAEDLNRAAGGYREPERWKP